MDSNQIETAAKNAIVAAKASWGRETWERISSICAYEAIAYQVMMQAQVASNPSVTSVDMVNIHSTAVRMYQKETSE
jgi:hypothetical protein